MATTTSQINEIKEDLSDAYTALGAKGATLPAANARGSANLASTVATVPSPDFPNILWGQYSPKTGHSRGGVSTTTFYDIPSYSSINRLCSGMEITCDISFRDTTYFNSNGTFESTTKPAGSPGFDLSFPAMTSSSIQISSNTYNSSFLNCCFESSAFKSVSFPELTTVNGTSKFFASAFRRMPNLTSVNLPKLETVTGYLSGTFSGAFSENTALTTLSFPALKTINCTNTQSYSLQDVSPFEGLVNSCSNLTSLTFPELETATTSRVPLFMSMLYGTPSLTTISFPKLTSVSTYTFSSAFRESSLTEIHFRQDMQATIEALDGYGSKFGASNATIYFDL